jgi:hypothetical protein
MTNSKIILGSVALAALLSLAVSQAANAQAGTVFGGYSTNVDANQDHITLSVNNLTATDFTDLTLTALLPASGNDPAVSNFYDYGTVAANGSLNLDLSLLTDFGNDPAHTFPGITPLTFTVTASQGSAFLSTTFNQSSNASGAFVGFEGISENGSTPYQSVPSTEVGILAPAAAVPESSTAVSLSSLCLGLGGLVLLARRRRA